jgi:hypothetical protein
MINKEIRGGKKNEENNPKEKLVPTCEPWHLYCIYDQNM